MERPLRTLKPGTRFFVANTSLSGMVEEVTEAAARVKIDKPIEHVEFRDRHGRMTTINFSRDIHQRWSLETQVIPEGTEEYERMAARKKMDAEHAQAVAKADQANAAARDKRAASKDGMLPPERAMSKAYKPKPPNPQIAKEALRYKSAPAAAKGSKAS